MRIAGSGAGCDGYNLRFMFSCSRIRLHVSCVLLLLTIAAAVPSTGANWSGVLTDAAGKPVDRASIALHSVSREQDHDVTTVSGGEFALPDLAPGKYTLAVS